MNVEHIGFSGTRRGMTNSQLVQVHQWLGDLQTLGTKFAHHGLCLGADHQFHWLARALNYKIIGHPGVLNDGSEYARDSHSQEQCFELKLPKPMLSRNVEIIYAADVVIACPAQKDEQFRGSGTWMVIRNTKKADKSLLVVYPDGAIDCSEPWYEQYRNEMAVHDYNASNGGL